MTIALRRRMAVEEFLAWDEGQEGRWEFDGFAPVAMTGRTRAHSLIATSIVRAMGNRLEGTSGFIHNGTSKNRVAGSIRYSDAFVAGSMSENEDPVGEDPVVVFEVPSPSTGSTDQIMKRYECSAMRTWVSTATVDPGRVPDMPEIGISVPLIEFYKGVLGAP